MVFSKYEDSMKEYLDQTFMKGAVKTWDMPEIVEVLAEWMKG